MRKRAYKAHILLVEDDQELAALLIRFLKDDYILQHALTPFQAIEQIELDDVDIILLDLTLPQMDGLTLCKKLHKLSKAKILISSARSAINDKLDAFEYGAEDYLPKPYDPRELKARIEILLKRDRISLKPDGFHLDDNTLRLAYNNSHVDLSTAEYEIFSQLFRHEGQIISREQLANAMSAHSIDSSLDSINVLIGRLRKKIKMIYNEKDCIKTIRLSGYKFESF